MCQGQIFISKKHINGPWKREARNRTCPSFYACLGYQQLWWWFGDLAGRGVREGFFPYTNKDSFPSYFAVWYWLDYRQVRRESFRFFSIQILYQLLFISVVISWITSSPKGNDRSPESNVLRSNLHFKKTYKWAMETRGPKSTLSELLCLSWLPATLMVIRPKMNKLAWSHHFPIISLWHF